MGASSTENPKLSNYSICSGFFFLFLRVECKYKCEFVNWNHKKEIEKTSLDHNQTFVTYSIIVLKG